MTDGERMAFLRRIAVLERTARNAHRGAVVGGLGVPVSILAAVLLLIWAGGR